MLCYANVLAARYEHPKVVTVECMQQTYQPVELQAFP